jgi:hypothetical protein
MPPYAGDFLYNNNAAYANNATPSKIEPIIEEEASGSEKAGRLDALLDFNPCTTMSGAGHSMTSAMFKVRPCSWCGKGCNKVNSIDQRWIHDTTSNDTEIILTAAIARVIVNFPAA